VLHDDASKGEVARHVMFYCCGRPMRMTSVFDKMLSSGMMELVGCMYSCYSALWTGNRMPEGSLSTTDAVTRLEILSTELFLEAADDGSSAEATRPPRTPRLVPRRRFSLGGLLGDTTVRTLPVASMTGRPAAALTKSRTVRSRPRGADTIVASAPAAPGGDFSAGSSKSN